MIASPIRTMIALSALACSTGVAGCEDTEKLQAIQKQADERVAQIQREATAQVAKVRTEMAALKLEFDQAASQAKAAASAAIEEARSDADTHAKEAEKALVKARDAYKAEGRAKLAALSADEKEIRAKLGKVKAKAKNDAKSAIEKVLKEADTLQKDVTKDLAEFDKASLSEFRNVKAKLNEHLTKLKAKIAAASAKLPKA